MSAKKIGKSRQQAPPPKSRLGWVLAVGAAFVVVFVAVLFVTRPAATQPETSAPPDTGAAPAAGPRLAVDQTEIDFGKVPVNKMVRADFTLSNTGSQALQILGEPLVELAQGC